MAGLTDGQTDGWMDPAHTSEVQLSLTSNHLFRKSFPFSKKILTFYFVGHHMINLNQGETYKMFGLTILNLRSCDILVISHSCT